MRFSNDYQDDENLDDLLSTEVVEPQVVEPQVVKPQVVKPQVVETQAVKPQDINTTFKHNDSVVKEKETLNNEDKGQLTKVKEVDVTTSTQEQVSSNLSNNRSERGGVNNLENPFSSGYRNIVDAATTTTSSSDGVIVSDPDNNSECGNESDTLISVNIESKSVSAEEEGVVFMGWKSQSTLSVSESSLGRQTSSTSVDTTNMSTSVQQPQPSPRTGRLGRKRISSGPEKQKKNLWQGMLSSNARWRSPNQKNHKKSSPNKKDQKTVEESVVEDTVTLNPNEDQSDFGGSDGNISQKIDFDDNVIAKDSEVSTDRKEKDNVEAEQQMNESRHRKEMSIDTNTTNEETSNPTSPPSLGFKNIDEQLSDPVPLPNFITTPTRQRKKTFGRNKMKIQPKSVKPSRIGEQSNIMSDDVKMQKEFVQIKPFYAYREGFQMSDTELYQEMMRKSSNVEILKSTKLSVGSGQKENQEIGSLKVEVLSCMGLPQFRRSIKPNSIAYVVCGDVAFATDVIHSSFSPMWPARSKRAAVFPVFHAYARLYTGIFNITDRDNDDYVGRSVVDLATLRPNVDYDIALPLKTSGLVFEQEPRGVVRLRIRLTWNQAHIGAISYIPSKLNEIFVDVDEPADLVTIPCADTKSLRNVAFTVYGEDLPGKYSKKAFRAINREMNLYKFQTPIVFRRKLLSLMSYEKPIITSYIFIGWMAILHFSAYHLAPSYLFSLLIVIHVANYHDLVISNEKIHDGFQPLSVTEIFHTLTHHSSTEENVKTAPNTNCFDQESYLKAIGDIELPVQDHVTFPFSESKYKRLPLRSMLCPKVSNKKRTKSSNSRGTNDWVDDSSQSVERDSVDSDNDSIVEKYDGMHEAGSTNKKLIPSGPEQDDRVETRENTFQENLKQIENALHGLTGNLFHEQVSRSIPRSNESLDNTEQGIPGLQANKFTNPLAVLSAAFLEPVMNVINVYLMAVRCIFNITHWRDPYLSFWFLVLLSFLMVFFALFPWKSFFFCSGILLFGPQNLLLKKMHIGFFGENNEFCKSDNEESASKEAQLKRKKKVRTKSKRDEELDTHKADTQVYERPLFTTKSVKQSKKKNSTPLEVVVPYSRARRERFYWPPYLLHPSHETKALSDAADTSDKKSQ